MARHGENIRRRKDGRWEGRYPVYSEEKGKRIYRSVYGKTYEEAKDKLEEQKKNMKKHEEKRRGPFTPEDILLEDAAREWLAEIKCKRKPSTYIKYELIWRNHIWNGFYGTLLSEITEISVREKTSRELSDSTLKSIYCVLNQILKFAVKRYAVTIPALKKPQADSWNKPVKVLAKSEQKKLISALYRETDIYKMAIMLCLFTGLRLGELCALKWLDIDFVNKILMVNRTVQRLYIDGYSTRTVLMETEPKSEYSKREIPLSAAVVDFISRFRDGREYVLGGNKPLEPRTMQNRFKKILEEAGLSDKNFHILRHTFSTNCIEGGTDVKSLSEMLGHSDVQITLDRYVHPSMDTKRRYMDSLSGFYGQIFGQAG